MPSLSVLLPSSRSLVSLAVVAASLAAGAAAGVGGTWVAAAAGLPLLFLLLTWDIRVIVPVLVITFPFGPRFAYGFGNLYVSTALLIVVLAAWIWRSPMLARPFEIHLNRATVSLAIFFAALSVSAIENHEFLAANKPALMRLVQMFIYAAFFVVLLGMPFSRRQIRALLALALLVGVIESAYGILLQRAMPGMLVFGTFEGGHSDFAVYAVFIAMLALGVLLEARTLRLGIASALGLGVVCYAIVFSFSRGGYLASAAALLVVLAMPFSRRRKIAYACALAAIVVAAYFAAPKGVRERVEDLVQAATGSHMSVSFVLRLEMWKEALRDFLDNPLFGRGTWSYVLRDNFYIRVLGESGIVGLASFIGVLVCILSEEWRAVRARVSDGFVRGVAYGLVPATVGSLVVFEFSGDFFAVHRFMGSFWTVLALTLKYCLGTGLSDGEYRSQADPGTVR